MKTPNPTWHLRISLMKSAARLLAGLNFMGGNIFNAGLALILAECLGILEELI